MMELELGNRLIVALDVADRGAADSLVETLGETIRWYKIGLELFTAVGPDIARDYASRNRQIMLDLKLHDIPATVGRATRRAAALGAQLLTIHAAGGRDMMRAAVEAAHASARSGPRLHILAVTVLTSMDDADLAEIGSAEGVAPTVERLAELAMEAGCDGVVASPLEAQALRRGAPEGFLLVTPGVRPLGNSSGDQKRTTTPGQARGAGADLVVVGRPIRDAESPRSAAESIIDELAEASAT